MSHREPPRISLASLPTPIERLTRMSARLGVDLWIKRDDRTGSDLTGNKVRKLEFLLAEAVAAGATVTLTCGGLQSNHARATVVASKRLGLQAHVLLRGTPPETLAGNYLMCHLLGAHIEHITAEQYGRRDQLLAERAEALRARGERPYVVPEGGSNGLGAHGYAVAMGEIEAQADALETAFSTVVTAVGSGGTVAGLVAGYAARPQRRPRPLAVPVCDSAAYFRARVSQVLADMRKRELPVAPEAHPDGALWQDGFVGAGYGRATPGALEAMAELAGEEGVLLDPTYTGKAWHALTALARQGSPVLGKRVLFLHTGGLLGLMARGGTHAEPISEA
jgi:D-cysteine desulfhydrase